MSISQLTQVFNQRGDIIWVSERLCGILVIVSKRIESNGVSALVMAFILVVIVSKRIESNGFCRSRCFTLASTDLLEQFFYLSIGRVLALVTVFVSERVESYGFGTRFFFIVFRSEVVELII